MWDTGFDETTSYDYKLLCPCFVLLIVIKLQSKTQHYINILNLARTM